LEVVRDEPANGPQLAATREAKPLGRRCRVRRGDPVTEDHQPHVPTNDPSEGDAFRSHRGARRTFFGTSVAAVQSSDYRAPNKGRDAAESFWSDW
jgi:hypothetical protein